MSHTTLPNTAATTIRVADLVEFTRAPDPDDAESVFQAIREQLHKEYNVILSFEGIDFITPSFMASSIGRLLTEFSEEEIRTRIQVTGMTENDRLELDYVIKHNVAYLKDPERYDQAFEKSLRGFKEF